MMDSSPSNYNRVSSSFNLLDPRIQHWIWEQGWTELRDAQEEAIPAILAGQDVIIAATIASGKTEAAFLPILTHLCSSSKPRATAMYISPLKALINDQWVRLEMLCKSLNIAVTPWHGDIPVARKKRFLNQPSGCLLLTPESLEALLIKYGHQAAFLFARLAYVVIDEVHAFMGTERGKQLQSLLHRLDVLVRRKVPRTGLSATLGDMKQGAAFLRPENPDQVHIICSRTGGQELKVLTLGHRVKANPGSPEEECDDHLSAAQQWVAGKLFSALRGTNNLVFPNSRTAVEIYADRLRKMCEGLGMPNEFWPHHGNLSREIREQTEQALKKKENPASAICTNTLELGLDIGLVQSVAQVGPPPSVTSLRQRLGRSGRKRGEPAILRAYCLEVAVDAQSGLSDLLREQLVQTIAMIRLLIQGWCEPVTNNGLHLSTLVQQLLSGIAQYGGLTAGNAWRLFCGEGPFGNLAKQEFTALLRALGRQDVIRQEHTGLLVLGSLGEKIVNHYSFYAAFRTDVEYRITWRGRTLGSLPIDRALTIGSYLIFAGRRWRIEDVDDEQKTVVVIPDEGGRAPVFFGGGARLHDRVREEMREVLRTDNTISFLDKTAASLLKEARYYYARLRLDAEQFKKIGREIGLFVWKGDNIQDTLALMLTARGLPATNEGLFLSVRAESVEQVYDRLPGLLAEPVITAEELTGYVKNKRQGKWDWLLPESLLNRNYASLNLDVKGALATVRSLVEAGGC